MKLIYKLTIEQDCGDNLIVTTKIESNNLKDVEAAIIAHEYELSAMEDGRDGSL